MMIPGEKGQKCDASVLAGGFLTLGPAQNMSKKPFFEEKWLLTHVFRIEEVQSTQQSGIRRVKRKIPYL